MTGDAQAGSCLACGVKFTWPKGQYTWNCAGCAMKITRDLSEAERKESFDCKLCDGGGVLPIISVENTILGEGEPVLRYGIPCLACPKGQHARSIGGGKMYPSLEHLPHWLEFREGKREGQRYWHFVCQKHEQMRRKAWNARKMALAIAKGLVVRNLRRQHGKESS